MNTELTQEKPIDLLLAYREWYIGIPNRPFLADLPNPIRFVGDFLLVTQHREQSMQVQMVVCKPGAVAPPHSHPNMDGLSMRLSGNVELSVSDGCTVLSEDCVFIPAGAKHGFTAGLEGFTYLNFEHWRNGKPDSVERDWDGEKICEGHEVNG